MGTGETGSGTSARHSWSAATVTGTTTGTTIGIDVTFDNAKADVASGDVVRLDAAAQQSSACAWVTECVEPKRRDSDLCIGQLVPLLQHAFRASGVACHPAQTATLPINSISIAATAAERLANLTTYVGC